MEAERGKMVEMWDLLTLTEEERTYFKPFYSHVISEDMLNLHELEVLRLEELYNKNQ